MDNTNRKYKPSNMSREDHNALVNALLALYFKQNGKEREVIAYAMRQLIDANYDFSCVSPVTKDIVKKAFA